MTGAKASLVVPLFNEAERLWRTGPLFFELVEKGWELVLVDDGSTDDTLAVARDLIANNPYARVIERPHLGKGSAVSAGIASATGNVIAFSDVDLATPLVEVERLAKMAETSRSLVIGSRGLDESRINVHEHWTRELLGRSYNKVVRLFLTPGIHDTQCGAKAAPKAVWEAVLPHCKERGFAWDVEVIAIAMALGIQVREIPVTWSHDKRTKVNVAADGVRMLSALPGIYRRVKPLRAQSLAKIVASESW